MSVLIHRCDSCTHDHTWHERGDCSYGNCRCARQTGGEVPELVPTFGRFGSGEITDIILPGRKKPGRNDITACGCGACVTRYKELTG